MRHRGWILRGLVLSLTVFSALSAQAVKPGRTEWKLRNFTWVKRVPAEAGAPANDHPAQLTEAAIQKALGAVRVQDEGKEAPLFIQEELVSLAKALREAFALSQPSEDLILLSTQRREGFFMNPSLGVTARLFLREGALNLIVHDARLDFEGRYFAEHVLPNFVYGSRKTASDIVLKTEGGKGLRADWLALPIPPPSVVEAPVPVAVQPAPAPPAVAPAPATPRRDESFYEAQAQRLKALKRLREDNLISEAEYQQKREEILKTL